MSSAQPSKKPRMTAGKPPDEVAAATMSQDARTKLERAVRIAIPASIGLTLAFMLWWTWFKWADVLVDFGRELYTPWQITKGKVLYRDIAGFYGPVSQYFNAALFEVFGVSLRTLAICNIAITLGLLAMMYSLLRAISGRLAATVACLVFVMLFAAAHHLPGISNYNYITPYSHEAMHGLVLSVASLVCLMRFQRSGRLWWGAGMGLTLGLVFLTKPESFVAAAPAVVGGLALTLWSQRVTIGRATLVAMVVLVCAALPVLAAWWLLSTAMPLDQAFRGVLGSWPFLTDRRLTKLPFFEQGMGIDHIGQNIIAMVVVSALYMIALAPALLAGLMMRGRGTAPRVLAAAGATAVPIALFLISWRSTGSNDDFWLLFPRPLPLFLVLAGLVMLLGVRRAERGGAAQLQTILRLAFLAFSLLLLLKMILQTRINHYGFILAMPATMMLVVMIVGWIPAWVNGRGGSSAVVQAASIATLLAIVAFHMDQMAEWLSFRTTQIGAGGDRLDVDYVRGPIIAQTLAHLEANMGPDQTLLAMPEGVMLNYLLRRDNPVPHLTYLPSDTIMFDEQSMLDELRVHPPDYIAFVHRPVDEYGYAALPDYAPDIMEWMLRNYDFTPKGHVLFGNMPYLSRAGEEGPHFGILVVRRKADAFLPRTAPQPAPSVPSTQP